MHSSTVSHICVSMRRDPVRGRSRKRRAVETGRSEPPVGNQAATGKGEDCSNERAYARTGADRSGLPKTGASIPSRIEALTGPARRSRPAHQREVTNVQRLASCGNAAVDSDGNAPSNIGLRPKRLSISFSS